MTSASKAPAGSARSDALSRRCRRRTACNGDPRVIGTASPAGRTGPSIATAHRRPRCCNRSRTPPRVGPPSGGDRRGRWREPLWAFNVLPGGAKYLRGAGGGCFVANPPATKWRTAECVLRRIHCFCLLALPSVRTLDRPPACCALCPRREPSTQIVHESRVVGRTHRRPPDGSPMSAGSSWSHPPQGAFIHLYFSPRFWLQHPCFRFHERRERRWCRSRFHRQLRPAGSQVT